MPQDFTPSPYQQAIFDFVKTGTDSGVIDAKAGSGKTTTIVTALEFINPDKKVLFLAFNKGIATELQGRVPKYVKAATFHSTWFGAWMSHQGRDNRVQVESNKTRNLVREEIGERENGLYGAYVMKMVGLAKGMGVGYLMPDDARAWRELAEHFDINLESQDADEGRAIELCQMILKKSIEQAEKQNVIDFDDMLYMPLIRNVRPFQYDFVFVDEAQDTNQVQIALLKRLVKPGGRLIAVGDPYQAIYGFRGADSEAMSRIVDEFGCQVLPLSVSYRCPQAVVRAAQEFVDDIEFFEGAPEGLVDETARMDGAGYATIGNDDKPVSNSFKNTDAILCRNTAPLVETAYHLIRNKVACRILGRDIGVGLENLIKKMQAKNIDSLLKKLDDFQNREMAKHNSKGREDKAQAVSDKVETLLVIVDNLKENDRNIAGLLRVIQELFTDNNKGLLTLATIHKSKGLEWPRVFILGRHELMPSKWARKAWQKEQEKNLIYVAYTRSKSELYFLPAPAKKNGGK